MGMSDVEKGKERNGKISRLREGWASVEVFTGNS